jgi:broad specificity phosphatase PhoE
VVVAHGGVGRLLRGLYSKLAPQEIPDLDVPQDALFRFFDGQLERHQTDIRQPVSRGPETLPA